MAGKFARLAGPAELAGLARLIKPAAKSTNIKKGSMEVNQDCVHSNSKFGPISKKPKNRLEHGINHKCSPKS